MNIAVKLEPSIAKQLKERKDHIIVTGATGWLGRAFIEAMAGVIGISRLHAFASAERVIELENGVNVHCKPMSEIAALPCENTYLIFHFAFLTKDKQGNMSLEQYVERNLTIRSHVNDALTAIKVSGLCVTSSGAVYTKNREMNHDLEAYPYAVLKVEEEEYFSRLCTERNIVLIIPRIFNMSGPHINKWDAYALASLLVMARRGEKLVIKARHSVIRSYCYIGDIVNVLVASLLHPAGNAPLVFDACLSEAIEIGALAERICEITGRHKEEITRDYDPALSSDTYLGDSGIFLRLCSEYGLAPMSIDEQIRVTDAYLRTALTL